LAWRDQWWNFSLCLRPGVLVPFRVWNGGMGWLSSTVMNLLCDALSWWAALLVFFLQLRGPRVSVMTVSKMGKYRMSQSIGGIAPATTRQLLMPLGRNFLSKTRLDNVRTKDPDRHAWNICVCRF
jgi:hypothetical protein